METPEAAFRRLFFYSAVVFTVPFVVFFGVRWLAGAFLELDEFTKNVSAVVAAVFVANAIIVFYVMKAVGLMKEEAKQESERQERPKTN